jgi:glycosyltransferase involved in cell wall biosynthesis
VSMHRRVAHVTTVDSTLRFLLLPQFVRLREEGFQVSTISAPGPWTRELAAEGIRHIPWAHATRSWNPASDALAMWELMGILRRERFHLVHTHNPKPGILGRLAARTARVPVVVNTVHGYYATPEDGWMRRRAFLALERCAARFSDLELYQSKEDLEWARRENVVPSAKSLLLGNGVNVSHFDPSAVTRDDVARLRRELGISESAVVVGTVARLVVEKGYRELFAAAASVRAALPEIRFLAVGPSDPDKKDAIGAGEIERAGRDVIFAGHRLNIPELLAAMDVFVLPSWREGVPRSAIEAAAMERPLILTDIRGCREVARDGIEGLLVPARDSHRLAGAIERLVRNPELRKQIGKAARARVLDRFDEQKVLDLIVSQYRLLLARKGFAVPGGQGRHSAPTRPSQP